MSDAAAVTAGESGPRPRSGDVTAGPLHVLVALAARGKAWATRHLGLSETVLAIFLTAGFFKADPRLAWLPVDLTILTGGAAAVLSLWTFFRGRGGIPIASLEILALFALMLPAAFVTDWGAYPTEKFSRFYTLTLLAALCPTILVRREDRLFRFLNALALLGLVLSADAAIALFTNPGRLLRITAFGSNTISLGRAAGMAFLWILALRIRGGLRIPALLLLPVLAIVVLASGSRGPLLATAVGGLLLLLGATKNRGKSLLAFGAVVLLALGAFSLTKAVLPTGSLLRVQALMEGRVGTSGAKRWDGLVAAVDAIPTHPIGLGFGGFATKINLWPDEERQFPHNIVAEVFAETGWLPGAYFLVLISLAFYRLVLLRRRNGSDSLGPDALLAFMSFLLINELVSGEMNDSKVLFAFLALTLGYQRLRFGNESRSSVLGSSTV